MFAGARFKMVQKLILNDTIEMIAITYMFAKNGLNGCFTVYVALQLPRVDFLLHLWTLFNLICGS